MVDGDRSFSIGCAGILVLRRRAEESGMNAVYRCFDVEGQCYEFRGDTEDACCQLTYLARSCFNVPIVDIIGETRAETENEDDVPETEFLKRGEEYKVIPLKFDGSKIFSPKAFQRVFDNLKQIEAGEEVSEPEEVPARVRLQDEVPTGAVLEQEQGEESEDDKVRPLIVIKVIEAKEESKDLSCLFG